MVYLFYELLGEVGSQEVLGDKQEVEEDKVDK
jgi:hypothetical protein